MPDSSSSDAPKETPEASALKPKTRSFWRALAVILGALLVLLFAGAAALVYSPPTEFLKGQIVSAVNSATGREMSIDGPAKFTVYPKLGVALSAVTLSGPANAVGADLLRAETVTAEIRPLSLLSRQPEITRIEVVRPLLTLRPDDKGLLGGGSGANAASPTPRPSGIVLKEVTITEGSASYFVQQPNPEWRINELSGTFTGASGQGEAKGTGSFKWRDIVVKFNGILSDASALGRGAASPMNLEVTAPNFKATLKGDVSSQGDGQIKGALAAKTESLRDLLRWFDFDPGPYALKGPATLEGPVTATPKSVHLERNAAKLDAGEGTIDAQVLFEPARPQITGNVTWRQLDLEKILGETPKLPAIALQTRAVRPGPTLAPAYDALSAELATLETGGQSLEAAVAVDRSKGDPTAWSKQAFNFNALTTVDLNFTASADTVKYGALEMRRSLTEVALQGGRLSYTVKQIEIDKGKLTGRLDIDAAVKPAKVAVSVSASDVAAERVLRPFLEQQLLSGTTKLDVVVSGRGQSEQEIVNSLEGTAKVDVEKGELVGFNIRQALLEWWKSWTFDPRQKTAFDRISASYGIRNGILRNSSDLSLEGSEIKINSSGVVALPSRTLDQKIQLQAVPPPIHFPVPIRVGGNWASPSINWDWLAIFKDPKNLAAPNSVAPSPEPPSPELKAAITKVLEGPGGAGLPPETRTLLQSLSGG